jgi:cytochrome c-type biogenesis protein CcmH/NrfG
VESILSHLPDDPDALTLLAEIRVRQDKIDEAIGILEMLLDREDLDGARKFVPIGRRRPAPGMLPCCKPT